MNSGTATSVYSHQGLREVKFLNHSLSYRSCTIKDRVCRSVYIHTEPRIFLSPLVRPHLQHYIQLWYLQQERQEPLGADLEEGIEMVRNLEYLCCEKRLRQLGLLSLEKKKFWRDLGEAFQFLKGAYNRPLLGPVVTEQKLMA